MFFIRMQRKNLFAEDYIYLLLNSRLREGFVFPRSVSWVFIIIHPYTQAYVVSFSFSIWTLLFTRRAEKISFSDSVSHFQEISSFVDQKSLLILCFWLKLPKNISSFPIKFRTITPAINIKSHQSFVGSVRLLDFWKSSQI